MIFIIFNYLLQFWSLEKRATFGWLFNNGRLGLVLFFCFFDLLKKCQMNGWILLNCGCAMLNLDLWKTHLAVFTTLYIRFNIVLFLIQASFGEKSVGRCVCQGGSGPQSKFYLLLPRLEKHLDRGRFDACKFQLHWLQSTLLNLQYLARFIGCVVGWKAHYSVFALLLKISTYLTLSFS